MGVIYGKVFSLSAQANANCCYIADEALRTNEEGGGALGRNARREAEEVAFGEKLPVSQPLEQVFFPIHWHSFGSSKAEVCPEQNRIT